MKWCEFCPGDMFSFTEGSSADVVILVLAIVYPNEHGVDGSICVLRVSGDKSEVLKTWLDNSDVPHHIKVIRL